MIGAAFGLREILVAACASSDLSESVHATEHALFADASHGDDSDGQHPCGDGLHGGCHLALALPAIPETATLRRVATPAEMPPCSRANVPPRVVAAPTDRLS